MKLYERIKACRLHSGLSQEQVAEALDVSLQAVTKWENGQSAPSTENIFKLAELFGTTVDLLLSDKGQQEAAGKESGLFSFLSNRNFWISTLSGLIIFFVIYPYGYNIYIPVVFTVICVLLNGSTCAVFAIVLHKQLCGTYLGEDFGMYLGLLIMQVIGHAIFSMMNWGSWVCIVLCLALFVWLLIKKRSENQKNNKKVLDF